MLLCAPVQAVAAAAAVGEYCYTMSRQRVGTEGQMGAHLDAPECAAAAAGSREASVNARRVAVAARSMAAGATRWRTRDDDRRRARARGTTQGAEAVAEVSQRVSR